MRRRGVVDALIWPNTGGIFRSRPWSKCGHGEGELYSGQGTSIAGS